MKKLIFVLIAICGTIYAQVPNRWEFLQRKDSTGMTTLMNLLDNKTYTATTKDTTIAYACTDWKNTFVTVQSLDSARVHIKYQLSADGTNWGTIATKDSLSTVVATGHIQTLDMTAQVLGARFLRFILDFTVTGVPQGTTTNTYDAILTRKQD